MKELGSLLRVDLDAHQWDDLQEQIRKTIEEAGYTINDLVEWDIIVAIKVNDDTS